MNTDEKSHGKTNHIGDEPVWDGAFRDAPAGAKELAEQRNRLDELKVRDNELAAIDARKCELEVECIAADVALKAASPPSSVSNLDPAQVTDIADAMHEKRRIEAALKALEQGGGMHADVAAKKLEQMKVGRDALLDWLDAPRAVQPQRIIRLSYFAVMIAVMVVIWSAIVVHPILLLLLVGLGTLAAFLKSSEQNTAWLRVGAKRHYEETGLKLPPKWEEAAVRNRMHELETQIEELASQSIATAKPADEDLDELEQLLIELDVADEHLDGLLAETGLNVDDLDADFNQWVELLSRSRQARLELDQLNAKHKAVSTEINATQEKLYRFLARQGEAPGDGSADYDSLSTGLDRVSARSTEEPKRTTDDN